MKEFTLIGATWFLLIFTGLLFLETFHEDAFYRAISSSSLSFLGEILELHYDERSEREKMELRRDHIEGA